MSRRKETGWRRGMERDGEAGGGPWQEGETIPFGWFTFHFQAGDFAV